MWWDAARIERTVTRSYVTSRLGPQNVERLDLAPGFGDGLTDGTYWEWIADKAKRIFLILDEIGIPDQIFLVVDNSWDDDDLPLPLDQVERLTASRDARLNRRFHDRQAYYSLREIDEGTHVDYEDDDVVPLDIVDTRHGVGLHTGSLVDKVTLPNRPGRVFTRRRVSVGSAAASPEGILSEARATKDLQNNHIVSYYASYAHQGATYLLFAPAGEYSLKTLLTTMPASLKALSKQDRRMRAMDWLHCLADSLCYLHGRGRAHGNIKPSNVLFDADHHPLLVDPTQLSVDGLAQAAAERAAFDKESYDYAAPEQWFRPAAPTAPAAPTTAVYRRSSTMPMDSSSSGSGSRGAGVPAALPSPPRSPPFSVTRFSSIPSGASAVTARAAMSPPAGPAPPQLDPQAADIFSLGCVMLEVVSEQLKRTAKAFAAHRGARHRIAGRGGAVLDTSFHKNLGQVQSWMAGLAKDAGSKKGRARADAGFFHGVAPTLAVVARMLAPARSSSCCTAC
jgi:serine/threonine protein kinase